MIRFMLDTNTCIYLIKYHPESIRKKLSSIPVGEVAISAVVSAELWYGVAFSMKKKENEAALKDFLQYIEVFFLAKGGCSSLWKNPGRFEEKRYPCWSNGFINCNACNIFEHHPYYKQLQGI
jgi:tRNA(fMet)-specific endonuclease VapC